MVGPISSKILSMWIESFCIIQMDWFLIYWFYWLIVVFLSIPLSAPRLQRFTSKLGACFLLIFQYKLVINTGTTVMVHRHQSRRYQSRFRGLHKWPLRNTVNYSFYCFVSFGFGKLLDFIKRFIKYTGDTKFRT